MTNSPRNFVFDFIARLIKTFLYICAWCAIAGVYLPITTTIYLILSIIDTWADTELAQPFINYAYKWIRE